MPQSQRYQNLNETDTAELELLLSEVEQGKKDYKIEWYESNQPAIRDFHLSTATQRFLLGGNRSGKTTASVMEVIWHSLGNYPDWYPKEGRLEQPAMGRVIIADHERGIGGIWEPGLKKWLPKGSLKYRYKNGTSNYIEWVLKNGSRFDFMTHKQEKVQYTGWGGNWYCIDEPCPRYCDQETFRGIVDQGGRMWASLTPDPEMPNVAWFEDMFEKSKVDSGIDCFFAETRKNPYLNKKRLEEWIKKLTDDEAEAKVHGRFTLYTGLKYPEFDEKVHMIPRFKIGLHDAYRVMCIDHHANAPTSILWVAFLKDGQKVVEEELQVPMKRTRIEDVCDRIRDVEDGIRRKNEMQKWVGKRLIDNSALTNDEATGRDIISHYRDHLGFITAVSQDVKSEESGRIKIKDDFHYLKSENGEWLKRPNLFLFDHCKQLSWELRHYIHPQYSRARARDENVPIEIQKKKQKGIHLLDDLRYIIKHPASYYKPHEADDEEEGARNISYQPASQVTAY